MANDIAGNRKERTTDNVPAKVRKLLQKKIS